MIFRWFGENQDPIDLKYIRQIPGMYGIVSSLLDIPVGDVWPVERIANMKKVAEDNDLTLEVIESVNIHDDIKIGLPSRDQYIENYKQSLRNLAQFGVKVVCYNFMPVFDWTRTELYSPLPDGSNTMSYDHSKVENASASTFFEQIEKSAGDFELPGWEPERLKALKTLMDAYAPVTEEKLLENLGYFLKAIIPVCEETDIKMAIHPDDPPWSLFGLPRIVTSRAKLEKIVNLVDSPYNGLTICSGCLGANPDNNIPEIIRYFGKMGRVHFGHVRNIKRTEGGTFYESSHLSSDGSLDLFEIMKAYYDIGFTGYIRPDHGRMIWGEMGRPGYGLYDRALGAAYINGLWEAIGKMDRM